MAIDPKQIEEWTQDAETIAELTFLGPEAAMEAKADPVVKAAAGRLLHAALVLLVEREEMQARIARLEAMLTKDFPHWTDVDVLRARAAERDLEREEMLSVLREVEPLVDAASTRHLHERVLALLSGTQ